MSAMRRALTALGLLAACSEREAPPPAASWLSEPLAAVRTSELAAGAKDSVPELANPYADAPDALVQGRQLYLSFNCAGCHGGAGGGGIGPPLADDAWIYGSSPANIYATIVQGRPNGMPAFGPGLQGEAVWKLAAYVSSLSEAAKEAAKKAQEEQDPGSGR
jgi:cytochrome c oxidase cbb3-type subunit III